MATKNTDYRDAGDRARDERDFVTAEIMYRRHLDMTPTDPAIWVQLGHAIKELRGHAQAVDAYRKAVALQPDSFDAYTHLAHSLKNTGDIDGAIDAFNNAQRIKYTASNARELHLLGVEVESEDRQSTTYFSVQDLLGYLHAHQTLSGIQRVQAGIASYAIREQIDTIRFIRTDMEGDLPAGSYWEIDPVELNGVISYALGANVQHERLRALLENCSANCVPVAPKAGDTIVLLGAFWGYGNTASYYAAARANGVRIGAYIYDLIPINYPEYCDPKLAIDFSLALIEIIHIADFFITISEFTAGEMRSFIKKYSDRDIPVCAVPLAHKMSDRTSTKPRWPSALAELKDRPYVLYVSTIEGRKNHQFILKIWQRLIDQGVDVPALVFIGRMGWRIDGLRDVLQSTDYLDGRVHIVHDISDAELTALYKNALFTVFSSFVEGWGLPVGESLVHGTPCIASATSSIPEVGGDFVDYMDPYSVQNSINVFLRMIEDNSYRSERARQIATNFRPRTWQQVSMDVILATEQAGTEKISAFSSISVPSGVLIRPGDAARSRIDLSRYSKCPLRLLFFPDFYGVETWGVWMKGRFGRFSFRTPYSVGRLHVYMNVVPAPWAESCKFTFLVNGEKCLSLDGIGLKRNSLVRIDGACGPDGGCEVAIKVDGEYIVPSNDRRNFALGIASWGYALASDSAGRTDLVESFTFHTSS